MPDYSWCLQHPPVWCSCYDQPLGISASASSHSQGWCCHPCFAMQRGRSKTKIVAISAPQSVCAPGAHTSSPPLQPISPDFYINLRVSYALTVKALKESIYLLPLSACQDQLSTWQSLTVHPTAQFLPTHRTSVLHMHKSSHSQLETFINLCWSLSKTLQVLLNLCKIYLRTEENPRRTNRG